MTRPRATQPKSSKPTPKVAAGGLAGAATIVAVFIANQAGVNVPPEVASAFTVLVSTAAAYLKPSTYGTG